MDWAHRIQSEEHQKQRILNSNLNYSQRVEFDFLVFDSNENFIASASWHPSRSRNKDCFEIGYWTRAPFCNRGYATLITKILTVAAFEFMGCDKVEIGCNKANFASKRVIEKRHFKFEGEIRNYFAKPTQEMLNNHYHQEKSFLLSGLTVDDLSRLPWFTEIKAHLTFISL
jgi:RimJ/RimL family protein N-acetyltransferase